MHTSALGRILVPGSMPPKPMLDEKGLQQWKGGTAEPNAIRNPLCGKHGQALAWERHLMPIISRTSGACVLFVVRCCGCDGEFSPSNHKT